MATYRTDEQLEELGLKFLRNLGLEHQVRPDLMTIIMKLKKADPRFNYRRVPDAKMPRSEAEWSSDDHTLSMRESVFVGMQRGDVRSCFAVSHELSHYALGHKGYLNRKTDDLQKDFSASSVKHQESEANRLAAIILAPEHLVPEGASAEAISTTFGLSLPAAIIRKDEVDRVRRRRRGELRPLPESVREMLLTAKRRGMNIQTKLD
jgi:IrrE N-terminal-like domain